MQRGGAPRARPKWPRMHRSYSVAAVLALTVLALSLPFSLAIAASAFAQEPEPPIGEPQPTPPEEPPETVPEEEPLPPPTGEQPGTGGGQLPRTGWDALLYFALGVMLLLGGARLRVLTRIREVVQRVRRRSTETALREALEPIRAARLSPPEPDPDPGPLHVEPSTPTARRLTGVAERD
jgi:hypothetical protein